MLLKEPMFNTFGYLLTGMFAGIVPLILNNLETVNIYIKIIGSSAATISAVIALILALWNLNLMYKKNRCKKNKNKN